MNDIKEIWQQAKEEFREEACKRFLIKFKNQLLPVQDNKTAEMSLDIIKLKPLPELFAHDYSFYLDAFNMWQWRYIDNSNDWTDCNKPLSFKNDKEYRRKTSAALPFDLERAKAGDKFTVIQSWCGIKEEKDTVSEFIDGELCFRPVNYHGKDWFRCNSVYSKDLRMKYPPKAAR